MSYQLTEDQKQTKEFFETIVLLAITNLSTRKAVFQMRSEVRNRKSDMSEQRYQWLVRLIAQQRRVLLKRGPLIDVIYKGREIKVYSDNEHGWKYLPVFEHEKNALPKYLYPHEFKIK